MANPLRKHLYIANWKMHKTITEAIDYLQVFNPLIHASADIYLAAPFTAIHALSQEVKRLHAPVRIGAQNMADEPKGAFTGEVSVSMLVEAGAQFVILGHSERRLLYFEDNAIINRKVHLALNANLPVIYCIGETQEERTACKMKEVLKKQLKEGLSGIKIENAANITIAYEPVWAIGNGQAATPKDAEEMQEFIRTQIAELWNEEIAIKMRILYGGSINTSNAAGFLEEKDIDGLLVGGASLDPRSFSEITNLN